MVDSTRRDVAAEAPPVERVAVRELNVWAERKRLGRRWRQRSREAFQGLDTLRRCRLAVVVLPVHFGPSAAAPFDLQLPSDGGDYDAIPHHARELLRLRGRAAQAGVGDDADGPGEAVEF